MKFEVWQEGIIMKPLMVIHAVNGKHAEQILKKAGIKNKQKLINIIEIDE